MPKPKRASSGVGHGANFAEPSAILAALATEVLQKEKMDELREQRKRSRKRAEANGVVLADLDLLFKKRDEPLSEIEGWFRRQFATLGAFFTDLPAQFDLFAPKPAAPERRAAFRHAGKMAGLKGEDGTPPPNLEGDELNQWMDGHAEGADARSNAHHDIIQAALENAANGQATDGTTGEATGAADQPIKRGRGRPKKAEAVAAQAAADFAADQAAERGETEMDTALTDEKVGTVGEDEPDPDEPAPGVEVVGVAIADNFELSAAEIAAQTGRPQPKISVKDLAGASHEVDADDPLVFEGVVYPTFGRRRAAEEAAKRSAVIRPQSALAAELRASAGV